METLYILIQNIHVKQNEADKNFVQQLKHTIHSHVLYSYYTYSSAVTSQQSKDTSLYISKYFSSL